MLSGVQLLKHNKIPCGTALKFNETKLKSKSFNYSPLSTVYHYSSVKVLLQLMSNIESFCEIVHHDGWFYFSGLCKPEF